MDLNSEVRTAKRRTDYQPAGFSIPEINLTFELDPEATRVSAIMKVLRTQTPAELQLDGQHLTLISIAINGKKLEQQDYQLTADKLIIPKTPAEFTLSIVTEISPQANTALEGLYLAEQTYCTQCEAEGFRRIMYFLDRPDVLSVYSTTIIADANRYPFLLSNGNKLAEHIDEAGKRVVRWHDPYPKPSYLFALVAGDFDRLEDNFVTSSGRQVLLQLYVDKGAANRGDFALQALKRAMRWDEQRFGLEYDLDIYMVVAVDFFNMGAMENKGLNIFNSKFVLADPAVATDKDYFNIESIIGHEYFHNWTGNRVTCRDWFQLSLKEGLTVFRDQEFSADMSSETVNRIDAVKLIRTAQFAEDASPMAHPIRPEQVLEMNNFYTVTVYDKGAEVIRMLQTLLGKEGFNAGLKLYLTRHDGQAVTCDDFVQAMQDANTFDLTQFRLWYSQAGTPHVTVTQQYSHDSQTLRLNLAQHIPVNAGQTDSQPLLIPVRIELLGLPQSQRYLLKLEASQQEFVFPNIEREPLVVWLEDFSAPVKLTPSYTDEQWLQIASQATDGVSRWDAMQQFWSAKIKAAVTTPDNLPALPEQLFKVMTNWLQQPGEDLALTAELLMLPDYDTLAEQYQQIPVDGILDTLQHFKMLLAHRLATELEQCYRALTSTPYQYNETDVAKRRLRNTCLTYLAVLPVGEQLINQQYQQSDNMTDILAALTASQHGCPSAFTLLLKDFAKRWQHDVLAMDKCFALAASAPVNDVFTAIETMQLHPLFSWKNPNRVRALYGAFSMRNPWQFHRRDGKGYQLLAEVISKLDKINPQVAARLVTPLLSWQRYESDRQQLMRITLQQIANDNALSNDVYEKVSKSLG